MKNTITLLLAIFICSKAVCSDKKSHNGEPCKSITQTSDTSVIKRSAAKNTTAVSLKEDTLKPKKEQTDIVNPFSWRPVLLY